MENRPSRHSVARDDFKVGDLVMSSATGFSSNVGIGVIKKRLTGAEVFDILGQEGYRKVALLREKVYRVCFSGGIETVMFGGNLKHANEK